jgi:hypothetical protein
VAGSAAKLLAANASVEAAKIVAISCEIFIVNPFLN